MHTVRIVRAAALAALLMVGATAAVEAQSLGRLGRAVKDRIGGAAQDAQAPGTQSQGAAGAQAMTPAAGAATRGAGLTADKLERLAAGLTVEAGRRREVAAELRALEPRADYEECTFEYGISTDGQRAAKVYADAVSAYYADAQNASSHERLQEAQRTFESSVRKACGPSPDEAQRFRQEHQAEPERAGAERSGMDAWEYARLKEIVLPFCAAADRLDAGHAASIPSGAGRNFSYSAEDTALLKPRCEELLPLIQATL